MYSRSAFLKTCLLSSLQSPPKNSGGLAGIRLLDEIQRRAVRFFIENTHSQTGITLDRARNVGPVKKYRVGSIAAIGYALACLPVGVTRGWVSNSAAKSLAMRMLTYAKQTAANEHGWLYHFIDYVSGHREWKCEISTVDTSILVMGALMAGRFWNGSDVDALANQLYDRLDWNWARTNGGTKPHKLTISHGWNPESGFLQHDWSSYCELMFIYLLGLGARKDPLSPASWDAWRRPVLNWGGHSTLEGGPIFLHQMAHGFFDFRGCRDRLGFDYHESARQATLINREYCQSLANKRKTYAAGFWGLNAGDFPDGYTAFSAPGYEDGTVSPTGVAGSIAVTPDVAIASLERMYHQLKDKLWGPYGFGNAFNLDRNWFGPDVIGIDLGMACLAIENHRTGLPWKLSASHPCMNSAWTRAGLHKTVEPSPRSLRNIAQPLP